MIAAVNGQDLPRLPFWIYEVTNIFWKLTTPTTKVVGFLGQA